MDELATGSVDLLLGMASGSEINAGLDLVESGGFNFTKYPRAGYGKLALLVTLDQLNCRSSSSNCTSIR